MSDDDMAGGSPYTSALRTGLIKLLEKWEDDEVSPRGRNDEKLADIVIEFFKEKLDPFTNFQKGTDCWLRWCMGDEITDDYDERNVRFYEEATELVQSRKMSRAHAHWMVDYVYDREPGVTFQEIGGVGVSLAALCNRDKINMIEAFETELERIWPLSDKIALKRNNKPSFDPESSGELGKVIIDQPRYYPTLSINPRPQNVNDVICGEPDK